MKAKYFFLALSAIALGTSCSNDEVTEVSDSNAIKFSVSTGKMSRADNVFCNNNLPGSFNVWASLTSTSGSAQTYIAGDVITGTYSNNTTTWTNSSGNRYWPNDGSLDFYAHVNADTNTDCVFTWNPNSAPTVVFKVPTKVNEQKDFLYAVTTDKRKSDGEVDLNFRHALSQIVFQAKNKNANLYVEIDGVSICNVGNQGTFTYPTNDTKNNIVDHDQQGTTVTYDNSWGTWLGTDNNSTVIGKTIYPVTFTKVEISGAVKENNADKIYPLTTTPKDGDNDNGTDIEYSSNALLLLPQVTTAWSPTVKPGAEANTGSYFLLKCAIYNVAGTAIDKESDVLLWGTETTSEGNRIVTTKDVAIPVGLNWEQGKKYIYTFVFGDGNGGYNPDPDTPEPVLFPITFEVTVDDFVDGGNTDVNMKTN